MCFLIMWWLFCITTNTWNLNNFEIYNTFPDVFLWIQEWQVYVYIQNKYVINTDVCVFLVFYVITEMEEGSICSNNGKIFQSHKLYCWYFTFKRSIKSEATAIRNGRLFQWYHSRAEDKSAGRARIWSHYTSESINNWYGCADCFYALL